MSGSVVCGLADSMVAQLNTRLDANLKQAGNAVFAWQGLNPSDVVRAVWQYAVDHQAAPDFMLPDAGTDEELSRKLALAQQGCGLAVRCAFGEGAASTPSFEEALTWQAERDAMYDEALDEMEARCR